MNKDRIQIDGVWYIKETTREKELPTLEYTFTENCVLETDKYCYEASRIKKDDGSWYDDINIDITIKKEKREEWKTDYWDNNNWMRGILDGNVESMDSLSDTIPDEYERRIFTQFLGKLVSIDWLKRKRI